MRGTHQIGGCVTEIKTAVARIIIDMGEELPPGNADKTELEIDGVTKGTPDCDAVLITHYHGDHVGRYEKVLPSVPIYMGKTAKLIYKTVQTVLKNKLKKGDPQRVENFLEYTAGKPIVFGDIKVTPYTVDHSAFDAYMLLIESEGKRILHTGDFRMHGARGGKMSDVFKKYAHNIDVLIIEGTMLSRPDEDVITEHELGVRAKKLLSENKNVFVICSSTNIDTIAEFYNAAIACKKPFIVCDDDYQPEILKAVTNASTSRFYKFDRQKIYSYGKNLHPYMSERGFCFLGRTNRITKCAIENFTNSILVYSMWRGYLDKTHPAYDGYKSDFISSAVNAGCDLKFLHTSGHATARDIKKVCDITGAETIIPIHCERPESFLELGLGKKIKILQDSEIFTI